MRSPSLRYYLEKVLRDMGGISHWAAKYVGCFQYGRFVAICGPCMNRVRKKGVFWKSGLFRKVHSLEILENSETPEILENPQTVENEGESDHFLEILENVETLENLEILPVKKPLS